MSKLIIICSVLGGAIALIGCSGGKEAPLQVEGGANSGGTAGGTAGGGASGSTGAAMQGMPNVVPTPDGK